MTKATLPSLLLLLGACAVKDSYIAHEAETRLDAHTQLYDTRREELSLHEVERITV